MSLDVPAALLERAQHGDVADADFIDCVQLSLPYAWQVINCVVTELELAGPAAEYADHEIPPPSESERGQLLRALASDAIRSGLERHFAVKLAFQNCHRVAVFRRWATDRAHYRAFISARGQLLNQSPELRDC